MSQRRTVILVVEDNAVIRMGVVDLLARAGFEALEAAEADEAIATLKSRPDIRLVFTDVGMPGKRDGISLAYFVHNRWPKMQLIIASGKPVDGKDQLPEGARFFLKPYHDDLLLEAVLSMLAERKPTNVA